MKKILLVFLAFLAVVVLVGCGDDSKSKVKKTVIQYCTWGLGTEEDNNLLRRRVEAFNKQSDTVRIEIIVPEGDYDEFISTLAAGSALPDVFMVNSVPSAVISELALDITQYAEADPEWNDIDQLLRDSITYNGHVFAIPAGQYYMGLFANLDLIDDYLTGEKSAAEMFAPGAFTTEEWVSVVKSMRDINKTDGTGVIGLNAVGDMLNWLPGVLDKEKKIKAFTWNGTSFDFTCEALYDAFEIISDLGNSTNQYVFETIPEKKGTGDDAVEYRSAIFGPGDDATVFANGRMGFLQQGSWADALGNVEFNCIYTSYPDSRVFVASDYMCISRSSAHPEIAYEVAKFLTFGEAGIKSVFDILDNNKDAGLSLTGIPVNTKKELTDKWFTYISMPGLKEIFDKVDKGEIEVIVELNKYFPGFIKARYKFNTGLSFETVRDNALLTIGDFLWETCNGNISINDYTSNMTKALSDRINKVVADDYAAMGLELPK